MQRQRLHGRVACCKYTANSVHPSNDECLLLSYKHVKIENDWTDDPSGKSWAMTLTGMPQVLDIIIPNKRWHERGIYLKLTILLLDLTACQMLDRSHHIQSLLVVYKKARKTCLAAFINIGCSLLCALYRSKSPIYAMISNSAISWTILRSTSTGRLSWFTMKRIWANGR